MSISPVIHIFKDGYRAENLSHRFESELRIRVATERGLENAIIKPLNLKRNIGLATVTVPLGKHAFESFDIEARSGGVAIFPYSSEDKFNINPEKESPETTIARSQALMEIARATFAITQSDVAISSFNSLDVPETVDKALLEANRGFSIISNGVLPGLRKELQKVSGLRIEDLGDSAFSTSISDTPFGYSLFPDIMYATGKNPANDIREGFSKALSTALEKKTLGAQVMTAQIDFHSSGSRNSSTLRMYLDRLFRSPATNFKWN